MRDAVPHQNRGRRFRLAHASGLLVVCAWAGSVAAEQQDARPDLSTERSGADRELVIRDPGGDTITLAADRIDIDLESGGISAHRVCLSACGDCAPPFSVSARRADLRPGGDLDLVAPMLRVGRVPVLALPWIRLRTGRRVGLLLPRLGWRSEGGLEVGQGLWVPLGSRAELTVDAAYLTDLVGAEISAALQAGRAVVRVTALLGQEAMAATIDGRLAARRDGLSAAARLDWTLDPEVERRFSLDLGEETRPWEETAVAVVYSTQAVQTALTSRLTHDLAPNLSAAEVYHPAWGLSFDLLPVRLGPIWLGAHQSLEVASPLAAGGRLWPSWRAVLRPRVATAAALGPLAVRWSITSLHAAWESTSDLVESSEGRHVVATALDLSLPLVKRLDHGRLHSVEPGIRYRLSFLDTLSVGPMSFEPWTWPIAGHTVWLGVRSDLREPTHEAGLHAEVGQVFGLPRITGAPVAPRLEAQLNWQSRLMSFEMHVAVDEGSWDLSDALVRARIGDLHRLGVTLSWRWLGDPSSGLVGADPAGEFPVLLPWFPGGAQTVSGWFWTPLGGGFRLDLGAWLDVESAVLIQGGGGLGYRHRCGCLGASLQVWYRAERSWPEIWLSVDIGGVGDRERRPALRRWASTEQWP